MSKPSEKAIPKQLNKEPEKKMDKVNEKDILPDEPEEPEEIAQEQEQENYCSNCDYKGLTGEEETCPKCNAEFE